VTTGEGGAVLTDDPHLAQRARDYRNHGIVHAPERRKADEGEWFYDIASIGQNFRLTDVQCALGLSQLSKLDRFLARRRQIARHYRAALADEHRIQLPFARDDDAHAWHLFPIRLSGEVPPRREVFERLRAQGILVQVHYVPVNSMHAYRALGHLPEQTPCALDAYRRLLSLPIFPSLRDEDVERVVLALREALP
jgi:dTDP-4-amino-4,6-dideoxygalactose transaminase